MDAGVWLTIAGFAAGLAIVVVGVAALAAWSMVHELLGSTRTDERRDTRESRRLAPAPEGTPRDLHRTLDGAAR